MSHRNLPRCTRRRQHGLGALAAILVLVMLSTLAAAVIRLGWGSQTATAQDVTSARALRAADAGAEWGLFQAFRGTWTACTNESQTLNLVAETGMLVTVTCSSESYVEGQTETAGVVGPRSVRVYSIEAVACNGTAACPDNTRAISPTYVERRRVVRATD